MLLSPANALIGQVHDLESYVTPGPGTYNAHTTTFVPLHVAWISLSRCFFYSFSLLLAWIQLLPALLSC